MGIFSNRKPSSLLTGAAADGDSSVLTQSDVLDHIVDLKDAEFRKLVKVALVYRKANKEASSIWGDESAEPEPESAAESMDDLEAAFLTDDDPEPDTKKPEGPASPAKPIDITQG